MNKDYVGSLISEFSGIQNKLSDLGFGRKDTSPTHFRLPTGILRLDMALRGGLSGGSVEICGPDSSGKTALLGQIIAQAQVHGMPVFLVAGDYLDIKYFERLGVDSEDMAVILGGIRDLEDVLLGRALMDLPILIAVDSLTSVRPPVDEGTAWYSMWYRILQNMKKYAHPNSLIVGTSQVRSIRRSRATKASTSKISDAFDTIFRISRTEVKETEYTMVLDIRKSSTSRPGVVMELPAVKGEGIQTHLDTVKLALESQILEMRGPRVYLNGDCIGFGAQGAAETVMKNSALYEELLNAVVG